MNYLEKYIEHCSGFYSFVAWLENQSSNGKPYSIKNQVLYLEPFLSKYFSLITVKGNKKHSSPFLGIQPIESEWFSLIKWKEIISKENDPFLYFVSETVEGDQEKFPDMPSFAIGIYIDTKEKMKIILSNPSILGREYFLDDNKQIMINFHKEIFNLKINKIAQEQLIVKEEHIIDYAEILLRQENKMSGYSSKPEFKGDIAHIDGTGDLLKKWKENNI